MPRLLTLTIMNDQIGADKVFKFSEETVKQIKKRYWIILCALPILMIAFSYFSPRAHGLNKTAYYGCVAFGIFMVELIILIQAPIMIKKMRELTLSISDESMERSGGKALEKVIYKEIQRLVIMEKASGQIESIRVSYANGKNLVLHGYENMESMVEKIRSKVTDPSLVQTKRRRLNWNEPIVIVTSMALTFIAILLIQNIGGANAYNVFNIGFQSIFGAVLLLHGPISRNAGQRFRKFEIIIGVILLVCSLAQAVLSLILHNAS